MITANMVTRMAYMNSAVIALPALRYCFTASEMAVFQARAAISPKAAVISAAIVSTTWTTHGLFFFLFVSHNYR